MENKSSQCTEEQRLLHFLFFSSFSKIPFGYLGMNVHSLRRVRLFATLWTVALQAPLSMGFSRQGYWSRLPCPPPGDLPNPGIELRSPALQADS